MYIPLHVHTTTASIGDSVLKIKDYVKKAKDMGLKALAITNHGSLADMYAFYVECINNGIKPIIGCEVYECQDRTYKEKKKKTKKELEEEEKLREQGIEPIDNKYNHLVLLATNEIGMKNLINIVSDAELVGKHYKPRTDLSFMKDHGEGIIALTACVGGRIPRYLVKDEDDKALDYYNKLKDIFDDVYLEIQPGTFEEQKITNKKLIEISKQTGAKIVATNDVHYLNEEDYRMHDMHVKSARNMKESEGLIYADTCYFLMNKIQIKNKLKDCGVPEDIIDTAILNTQLIADRIQTSLDLGVKMPEIDTEKGLTTKDMLLTICLDKIDRIKHKIKDPNSYVSRLYHEVDIIDKLGFCPYFLMVRDLVLYANRSDIPVGPGRGSVCGSITAYLADITKVDSIKYNLIFARFLDESRKGLPDVDLDFSSNKRHLMGEYAVNKYGAEYCAQVATVAIRKAKAAIRDSAKIYDIPLDIEDEVAKLIPMVYYTEDENGEEDKLVDLSIEQSLEIVPELREYYKIYPEWIQTAMSMEGLPKNTSTHAAGVLISNKKLSDILPLVKQKDSDKILNATSIDMAQADIVQIPKMDFLGLATLYVIDTVEKNTGCKFDVEFDNYDDPDVWKAIGSRYTTGLFQIASKTYRDRMPKLSPKTIEELAACLALVRGPCISAGTDKLYMDIVQGKEQVHNIHPIYDNITKDTNGIMIYQEQTMELANKIGISMIESYKLLKACSKKKADLIATYEKQFKSLALDDKNISSDIVELLWKMIMDSAKYSFNKGHSVAYAILCYISAYYKVKFPKEFMAAELTNAYQNSGSKKEKIQETIQECRRLGISFLPIDINKSSWEFKVEGDSIRLGFSCVSGFGMKAGEAVNKVQSLGEVIDVEDFYEKIEAKACNKKATIALILAGAFGDRTEVYNYYHEIREEEPASIYKMSKDLSVDIYAEDYEIEELMLGSAYTTNLINNFESVDYLNLNTGEIVAIDGIISRVKPVTTKAKKKMCYVTYQTADGFLDMTVFPKSYEDYKKEIKKNKVAKILVKKEDDSKCVFLKLFNIKAVECC